MNDETWEMYAQRRHRRERKLIPGNLFYRFGVRGWAEQADGDGVFRVELSPDTRGTYWAWQDKGSARLTYVSDSEADLERAYRAGDNTVDMRTDEKAGRGRVRRLSVRELEMAEG